MILVVVLLVGSAVWFNRVTSGLSNMSLERSEQLYCAMAAISIRNATCNCDGSINISVSNIGTANITMDKVQISYNNGMNVSLIDLPSTEFLEPGKSSSFIARNFNCRAYKISAITVFDKNCKLVGDFITEEYIDYEKC